MIVLHTRFSKTVSPPFPQFLLFTVAIQIFRIQHTFEAQRGYYFYCDYNNINQKRIVLLQPWYKGVQRGAGSHTAESCQNENKEKGAVQDKKNKKTSV